MIIVAAMVSLALGSYGITKSNGAVWKKLLSILSMMCLGLLGSLFWNEALFNTILDQGLFWFGVIGVLGILLGLFGVKGTTRVTLVTLHVVGLMLYGVLVFIGTVGFQEP
ncbi:hypothetical protein NCCP2716_25840 [Sporosarcina sp. NCCP-2716]|uniref:hypothetical protein n=1 Tax=Sporosarcina sp. NCCP-2716 TaxID=2943679 RepID=UPI00203C1579|nr:hypothetical protein [Sporosarcina sp. NCCP-2716]GKV70086.1 hypothetical protein NCCP2716_25840 [Sporosarcina sp. NCCP-2716]